MPRYYCDYCDTYLTHDSPAVRKQHNAGYKHKANVRNYYMQFEERQGPSAGLGVGGRGREYDREAFQAHVAAGFSALMANAGPGMGGPPPVRPGAPMAPPHGAGRPGAGRGEPGRGPPQNLHHSSGMRFGPMGMGRGDPRGNAGPMGYVPPGTSMGGPRMMGPGPGGRPAGVPPPGAGGPGVFQGGQHPQRAMTGPGVRMPQAPYPPGPMPHPPGPMPPQGQ